MTQASDWCACDGDGDGDGDDGARLVEEPEETRAGSLHSDLGDLVPVLLVLTAVLAKVDGSHLEHAESGALSIAARRGGASLVLGAFNCGLRLPGPGVRGRGDGAEGQEVEKSSTGARHCDE